MLFSVLSAAVWKLVSLVCPATAAWAGVVGSCAANAVSLPIVCAGTGLPCEFAAFVVRVSIVAIEFVVLPGLSALVLQPARKTMQVLVQRAW